MVSDSVIFCVVRSHSLTACAIAFCLAMIESVYASHADVKCVPLVIFSASTRSAVSSDACGEMNTTATVLMFVSVLSAFTSPGKPFKTKLCFIHTYFPLMSTYKVLLSVCWPSSARYDTDFTAHTTPGLHYLQYSTHSKASCCNVIRRYVLGL